MGHIFIIEFQKMWNRSRRMRLYGMLLTSHIAEEQLQSFRILKVDESSPCYPHFLTLASYKVISHGFS